MEQEFNSQFEIIVVDGGSDDDTKKLIKLYQKNYSNILLINNIKRTVPIGFNMALAKAKGDVIVRIDGHSELKPNFLKNCILALNKTNSDCVGGPTIHVSNSIVGESIKICQTSLFGSGGVQFRKEDNKSKYVDTLAFGAYKRRVFKSIGGYDEELIRNQDDEFNFRLIQNGGKIWLDSSIKSIYYTRNTLFSFAKQYFQYGLYKIRVIQKRRNFSSIRHLIPFIFVLLILGSIISSYLYSSNIQLFLLSIIYFSISFIFTIHKLSLFKYHILSITLLPIVYFVMHFSYGVGSLIGLIYFINKWKDNSVKDNHFNIADFE